MNKLIRAFEFLEILSSSEKEILDNLEIIDQKIKDNKFCFTLLLPKPFPVELYKKIKLVTYEDIKIETKIAAVKKINTSDVKQYLLMLADQFPELKLYRKHVKLEHFCFEQDTNTIYFNCAVESEILEINKILKDIIDLLKDAFGLPILDFVIQENIEFKERISSKKELLDKQLKETIKNRVEIKNIETNQTKTTIDSKHLIKLDNLIDGMINASVIGQIFNIEIKDTIKVKSYKFFINDYHSTFVIKYVIFKESIYNNNNQKKLTEDVLNDFKINDWILATIDIKTDKFENEVFGAIKKIISTKCPTNLIRHDNEVEKRVELTVHSKMSAFDGIIEVEELAKKMKEYGYGCLPITDRYNIQAFPEIQKLAKKHNLKPIYGCEVNILPTPNCVVNSKPIELNNMTYIVFDLETTGLNPVYDDIIEFGAIKYVNGIQAETMQFFIKPTKPISDFTTQLTGITNDNVKDAINQAQGIAKILEFIGDTPLIAHNAIFFDFRFLVCKSEIYLNRTLCNTVIDTLHIARGLFPNLKSHTLEKVCRQLEIEYKTGDAHRADYDASVLNQCWTKLLSLMLDLKIKSLDEINFKIDSKKLRAMYQSDFAYVYPKNAEGLKKLNEIISLSHTKYFYNNPKIPWDFLDHNRENLIIAPNPVEGEVIHIALTGNTNELKLAIAKYDYIFIAPVDNFLPLINSGELTEKNVEESIMKIVKFSLEQNKKIIAVSDAYYINPLDKKYQNVYLYAKAINGRQHRYYRYKVLPNQHIRLTDEMKQAFQFLDNEKLINEIVILNSHEFINNISSDIFPIKDRLYAPKMDNVDELLTEHVYKTAHNKYGDKLPIEIEARIKRELDSIITHEFSVVYWISHLLVKKSNEDGYPVGSRGSVGSSLVATMLNITDVNPMAPHYLCQKCKYCIFDNSVDDGYDLMPSKCPKCDGTMYGDGHDIPFETFLGFEGDKTPDIDLNFSGEYQSKAHDFIKEMFGAEYAFRAGTISTIAEKTCYSIVKSYFDEINQLDIKQSELSLYVKKALNVKRTTGQHPGGILVVPKEYSIYDFSPFNFPADDTNSEWCTTHYAFEYLHDNLLKFDILGHDNPTILKRLKDLTGIDERDVPNHDNKVLKLFTSIEPLDLDDECLLDEKNGAISIPEFGTKFVREMLADTQPQSFADLVRISGLSHGTNVYVGNAKNLIKTNGIKLCDVIGCRDDIMIYLINKGLNNSMAFKIMEDVRKGKKLKPEYIDVMKAKNVPNWYIDSCNKIEYMFPKAHATAYVMHAWKFAWYKIYHPLPYYSTFFTTKADSFEIDTIAKGKYAIKTRLDEIRTLLNNKSTASQVKKKEIDLVTIFEVCLEMYSRGFKMLKPDIFLSDATEFVIYNNSILAPFNCIEGLGDDVARTIVEARSIKPFISLYDVIERTRLNKTSITKLQDLGVFDSLPKNDQIGLFDNDQH